MKKTWLATLRWCFRKFPSVYYTMTHFRLRPTNLGEFFTSIFDLIPGYNIKIFIVERSIIKIFIVANCQRIIRVSTFLKVCNIKLKRLKESYMNDFYWLKREAYLNQCGTLLRRIILSGNQVLIVKKYLKWK